MIILKYKAMEIKLDSVTLERPVDFKADVNLIVHTSDDLDESVSVLIKCEWDWQGDDIVINDWWVDSTYTESHNLVIRPKVSIHVQRTVTDCDLSEWIFNEINK